MFWYLTRKKLFYDPDKCEVIMSKYTGNKYMQVLRALVSMELSPRDIKNFHIYGTAGYPPDETYRLITRLDQEIYKVKRYDSGSNFSMLQEVELTITDGEGIITEHWVCA